jgi:hypothetical protein
MDVVAERVGFEPTVEFPLHTLSKRAPSTARPSLRIFRISGLRASGSAQNPNCDRNCDTPPKGLRSLTGTPRLRALLVAAARTRPVYRPRASADDTPKRPFVRMFQTAFATMVTCMLPCDVVRPRIPRPCRIESICGLVSECGRRRRRKSDDGASTAGVGELLER